MNWACAVWSWAAHAQIAPSWRNLGMHSSGPRLCMLRLLQASVRWGCSAHSYLEWLLQGSNFLSYRGLAKKVLWISSGLQTRCWGPLHYSTFVTLPRLAKDLGWYKSQHNWRLGLQAYSLETNTSSHQWGHMPGNAESIVWAHDIPEGRRYQLPTHNFFLRLQEALPKYITLWHICRDQHKELKNWALISECKSNFKCCITLINVGSFFLKSPRQHWLHTLYIQRTIV